jgi:hypothetical protein
MVTLRKWIDNPYSTWENIPGDDSWYKFYKLLTNEPKTAWYRFIKVTDVGTYEIPEPVFHLPIENRWNNISDLWIRRTTGISQGPIDRARFYESAVLKHLTNLEGYSGITVMYIIALEILTLSAIAWFPFRNVKFIHQVWRNKIGDCFSRLNKLYKILNLAIYLRGDIFRTNIFHTDVIPLTIIRNCFGHYNISDIDMAHDLHIDYYSVDTENTQDAIKTKISRLINEMRDRRTHILINRIPESNYPYLSPEIISIIRSHVYPHMNAPPVNVPPVNVPNQEFDDDDLEFF